MKEKKAERIAYLKKRYSLARRRARYWSGNPSFSLNARSRCTATSKTDIQYELALCDIKNLAMDLKALGVDADENYNPKREFQLRFSKVMHKI